MKITTKFFLMMGLGITLFVSCKKDDPTPTTAQRVQGVWKLDQVISYYQFGGFPAARDTTFGLATDYVDFRTDNKVYSFVDGSFDTSTYTILNDNTLILDGDTAAIQTLTATNFNLFLSDYVNASNFSEVTIKLKK